MSTPTKNATIYYSINGGDYQKYTDPLIQNDACTINTYCTGENLMDSPVMTYDFDLYINKSAWKLVSADSQHSGNEARLAFDGRNDTFWHTEWGSVEPACPHTIVIDMASEYKVTAITYLSRQDGNQNGMVKNFEVYLSNDGSTWGSPVVSGQFKNTTSQQVAKLTTPTTGRYLKFVAKSEINGNAWTSAAEIGIQVESDHTAIGQVKTDYQQNTAAVYDLNGRRMNGQLAQQPKGIYISNGRKIVK
jgi:beta-galactosidase